MWLVCRFLDTEVDGSTQAASTCCVLEIDTLSASFLSTIVGYSVDVLNLVGNDLRSKT